MYLLSFFFLSSTVVVVRMHLKCFPVVAYYGICCCSYMLGIFVDNKALKTDVPHYQDEVSLKVRNFRMRFSVFSYSSSFSIKMHATDAKTQKIEPDPIFL